MSQRKGLRRNTIDKYYTKPEVVTLCFAEIKNHIQISPAEDIIIEPAAGGGAFIAAIKEICYNYKFYDIAPEHPKIAEHDYLAGEYGHFKEQYGRVHVVGNPPFGRQSSTAAKFIKKSAAFADTISFILPRSFRKESLRRNFPPQFHLVRECDLPANSFLVDGTEYDVPCVFQIWERRAEPRAAAAAAAEPRGFIFVKKEENPDISFRRVGAAAGKIDSAVSEKSVQSHYFIRFTNGRPAAENIAAAARARFDTDNTVGPRSISKREIIEQLNSLLLE